MLYELSEQFLVLIYLLHNVISVAAIEVDEPLTAGYDTCLHYYRPQTVFQNPVINCIWSVACYIRHISNCEYIRHIEPLVGQLLTEELRWSLWLNSFRRFLGFYYIFDNVIKLHGVAASLIAVIGAGNSSALKEPSTLPLADVKYPPQLLS